jgi:hypothetical protein
MWERKEKKITQIWIGRVCKLVKLRMTDQSTPDIYINNAMVAARMRKQSWA